MTTVVWARGASYLATRGPGEMGRLREGAL